MPTYEYVCRDCGTHVDAYQRFSDEPLTVCGVCGGELRKVFHPAGILFKGSGFYATDSRRSSSSKSSSGEKSEKVEASAKSESSEKSDSSTKAASSSSSTKPTESSSTSTKEKSA